MHQIMIVMGMSFLTAYMEARPFSTHQKEPKSLVGKHVVVDGIK
jgi:hypothetical protein